MRGPGIKKKFLTYISKDHTEKPKEADNLQGKIYLAFMLLFLPSTTECKGPFGKGYPTPSEGYVTVSPSSKDEVCFCKENKTKIIYE